MYKKDFSEKTLGGMINIQETKKEKRKKWCSCYSDLIFRLVNLSPYWLPMSSLLFQAIPSQAVSYSARKYLKLLTTSGSSRYKVLRDNTDRQLVTMVIGLSLDC